MLQIHSCKNNDLNYLLGVITKPGYNPKVLSTKGVLTKQDQPNVESTKDIETMVLEDFGEHSSNEGKHYG